MNELRNIALANLKTVEKLLAADDGDDLMLNIMAYHLQQAAELFIKNSLECSGIRYNKTHDIEQLLRLSEDIPHKQLLLQYADTLTVWESKTRYVKDYRTSRDKILTVFGVLNRVIRGEDDSEPCVWFNSLSLEQKRKLKELNRVVYNACVEGDFDEVAILIDFYKDKL